MVRVLILGAGSIGTLYAFVLFRAGAEVVCVCRSNYEEARSQGFRVRSTILGDHTFRPGVVNSVDEAMKLDSSSWDYVVVCVKSVSSGNADPSTGPLLHKALSRPKTALVLIQNGIGVEDPYRKLYPKTCIISAVTTSPTKRISPTYVHHTEAIRICLGLFETTDGRRHEGSECSVGLNRLAMLMSNGGATAEVHDNIQTERWKKVIANGAWNPICALSRCRDLEFLATSSLANDCVRQVMEEISAVAKRVGSIEEKDCQAVEAQMRRTEARPWPGVEPSMMADMLSGKALETETVVGHVVQIAKEHGVATPRLDTLYVLLKALDWSLRRE